MKKTWVKMIVMVFMTFLISSCSSVDPSIAGGLPSGEEIIERNIKATGGRRALESVRNNKTESTNKMLQLGGLETKETSYKERPDKNYKITDFGTVGKYKSGSDGKIAWEINPFFGTPRLFEGDELADKLRNNSFDGPDAWKRMYKSVKNEGVEDVNGKECYKIVFMPREGAHRTVYYDKKTFLINKAVSEMKTPQGTSQVEVYFSDYKKAGKILSPYKTILYSNGQLFRETTIESIETNIEIPEGTFDLPEEIKTIIKQKAELSYSKGQTEEKPKERQHNYFVAIYRMGPNGINRITAELEPQKIAGHAQHLGRLRAKGESVLRVGYMDGMIQIFDFADAGTAKEKIREDPILQAEFITIDIIPATEAKKKAGWNDSIKEKHNCIIALYRSGPNWVEGKSIFDQPDFEEHTKHVNQVEADLALEYLLKDDEGVIIGKLSIYDFEDAERLRMNLTNDPIVQSKVVSLEIQPTSLMILRPL